MDVNRRARAWGKGGGGRGPFGGLAGGVWAPFRPGRTARSRAVLFLELVLATLLISVALVGILGGFRTVIEANTATCDRATRRLLVEQKLGELEAEGVFKAGEFEGEFSEFPGFHWKTIVTPTENPELFRIELTVSSARDSMNAVVDLRQLDAEKGGGW